MIKDHMAYITIISHPDGPYVPERDVADMDRKSTVEDIACGELEDVLQVIECNPVEGTCRDVTEDIAWEVSAIWSANGEPLSDWQQDFIEQTIGLEAAGAFPRAA